MPARSLYLLESSYFSSYTEKQVFITSRQNFEASKNTWVTIICNRTFENNVEKSKNIFSKFALKCFLMIFFPFLFRLLFNV